MCNQFSEDQAARNLFPLQCSRTSILLWSNPLGGNKGVMTVLRIPSFIRYCWKIIMHFIFVFRRHPNIFLLIKYDRLRRIGTLEEDLGVHLPTSVTTDFAIRTVSAKPNGKGHWFCFLRPDTSVSFLMCSPFISILDGRLNNKTFDTHLLVKMCNSELIIRHVSSMCVQICLINIPPCRWQFQGTV